MGNSTQRLQTAGFQTDSASVQAGDAKYFEQQVNQADLDRDPFAIALFELEPFAPADAELIARLARRLLDFSSPSTHIAQLGDGRLAVLARTVDTTNRWVAPMTSALTAELTAATDVCETSDVSDVLKRPRLVTGVANGLTRHVWLNAEAALITARQTPDPAPTEDGDQDRLILMAHRLEPVDRPEPEWLWLRLTPGLRSTDGGDSATPVDQTGMASPERAALENWLADHLGDLFAETSDQLRVSLPITSEAGRSRSFAQRIFRILERHRIPPSRLVLEIEAAALIADGGFEADSTATGSQPSVRRFVQDALAMNVAVTVSDFDGGWASWHAIQDLPITYLKPWPDLVNQAGVGDVGAVRALTLLCSDAERRGIELIVPDTISAIPPAKLSRIGFAYEETPAAPVIEVSADSGPGRADRTPNHSRPH